MARKVKRGKIKIYKVIDGKIVGLDLKEPTPSVNQVGSLLKEEGTIKGGLSMDNPVKVGSGNAWPITGNPATIEADRPKERTNHESGPQSTIYDGLMVMAKASIGYEHETKK